MKLHTKVVLARANPSFEQGLARPSTGCTFTQRKIVWCTGLVRQNADIKEIERVAVDAAAQMDEGDTLIWDRLGRSGRALHPIHQHSSPEEFKERGVSIKFLPPKGKYFNPIELLFNDLKSLYIRPNFPKNGKLLSESKIQALVREYMDETAPSTLPGFFSARANGKDAITNKIL